MSEPSWRSSQTVQGVELRTGDAVPVVVGLVDTAAGGVHVALQVGDHRPVILALQDARRLALDVNETTAERLRVAADSLGNDRQRGAGDGTAGEGGCRPRGGVMCSPPPWRYVLGDGRLHMIRHEVSGVAEALCPLRVAAVMLLEPGGEDQPRCSECVRVYGSELSRWNGWR